MSFLERLIGLTLSRTTESHDSLQLFFDGNVRMNIDNPWTLEPPGADLTGRSCVGVEDSLEDVVLRFEGNVSFRVDLRSESYRGPEAMTLSIPGQPLVVWN